MGYPEYCHHGCGRIVSEPEGCKEIVKHREDGKGYRDEEKAFSEEGTFPAAEKISHPHHVVENKKDQ